MLPPPFTLPQLPPSCFNLGLLDLALRPFLHLLSRPVAQLLTWLLVGASRTKLPPFPSSTARSMPGLFPPWGLITPLWAAAFLLRPVPWPLPISFPCLLPLPGLALTSRWHGGASCSLLSLTTGGEGCLAAPLPCQLALTGCPPASAALPAPLAAWKALHACFPRR